MTSYPPITVIDNSSNTIPESKWISLGLSWWINFLKIGFLFGLCCVAGGRLKCT